MLGIADAAVFDDQAGVFQALQGGQIDATVAALPTALYATCCQVPEGKITALLPKDPEGRGPRPALRLREPDRAVDQRGPRGHQGQGHYRRTREEVPRRRSQYPDNQRMTRRPGKGRRQIALKDRLTPVLISLASVVVVFGALIWFVGSAEQWPRIQLQFFSLEAMIEAAPGVAKGFLVSLQLWLVSLVAIGIWALILAIFRAMGGPWFAPLRVFAILYVDLFRGLPALLLVLLFGFGIPALNLPGLPKEGLFWGAVALILSYSAYATEVYRSGIEAVHEGQSMAAKALGLTQWQTLRYAILPQALRNVVPAMLNLVVALQKDVALLSVLGVRDAVREAQIYTARTFNYSSLVVAAILFLLATIPLARLTDHLQRRDRQRRLQGAL
jgi:polar amino acid transport system permease protein